MDRTVGTGQPEQKNRGRTFRKVQLRLDSHDGTTGTRQPRHDSRGWISRTGQPGQESQNSISLTGQVSLEMAAKTCHLERSAREVS